MEKRISYLNRTYADYKEALIEMSERCYPDLAPSFRDSSVGEWHIDMLADVADNLSYHIDRVFQETNINSAQEKASLFAIARNNGVKIPGPKGSIAEVRISTILHDVDTFSDAPIIKRGTKFASGSQQFELLDDIDFADQFSKNGDSDRTYELITNSNGIPSGYKVSKTAIVTAGESKIYSKKLTSGDIKPFMEIILPVENVMSIESILVIDGDTSILPTYGAFYSTGCTNNITRFYEVDNLAQNKCWVEDNGEAMWNSGMTAGLPYFYIKKGKWEPIVHKFITEYTNNGYLKIIFGAGNGKNADLSGSFNEWQMSRILNNNNLGVLPRPNTMLYILYRVGGGASSNVAKGAINRISNLNIEFRHDSNSSEITSSLRVENTTPSFSGKDMPSEEELKYYIKYHKAAQERCVTIKDYIDRILLLPPKYGTPFRVGVAEENNKIVVYLLGIDNEGKLSTNLPSVLVDNIKNYLNEYRVIGDCIEVKSGRIIHLGFDIEAFIDENYNDKEVIGSILKTVEEYMNINHHFMGEKIFVGDLLKEIGKVDGVINVYSIKVKNLHGDNHSSERISQETNYVDDSIDVVDLIASDWILYNDGDTMMEIKNPATEITISVKKTQ